MSKSHRFKRWANVRHFFVGNNENKKRFGFILLGIGFAVFLSAIFLPFPLVLTGTIAIIGFTIISSFTIVGFIIGLIGAGVLSSIKAAPVSPPSINNVELQSDKVHLPLADSAAANKLAEKIRKQGEREALYKAESAILIKYRDIANILNVRPMISSVSFWQSQTQSSPKNALLLATTLARKGHEDYPINSRFAPSRTVADQVAMSLADPRNAEVKSEIIAELIKLDLPDFTQEQKDKLIDTLNRGERILQYCEEVSQRNAGDFLDHLSQTPWSTT